jgi:hypothetical protein
LAAVTDGPGGCAGVDALIAMTEVARRRVAGDADPGAKSGHLGEFILLESPYEGFDPAYVGPMTPAQARDEQRFGDLKGFVAGYSRLFVAPRQTASRDGFARAQVYEYNSPAAALASVTQHVMSRCQDTASTFTIPSLPDAVGISVRSSSPRVSDEVLFVRGPRRYLITRGMNASTDGHRDIAGLAIEAATLAR